MFDIDGKNVEKSEESIDLLINNSIPESIHGIDVSEQKKKKGKYNSKGKVLAVCISEKKGEQKHIVEEVELKENWGIVGDAHAGEWQRQVSLLAKESVLKLQKKISFELHPGNFAENILIEGLLITELPVGTYLRIGEALTEITQIGKECHNSCPIREATGDCIMPKEGIFVKVIESGHVVAGDAIEIIEK